MYLIHNKQKSVLEKYKKKICLPFKGRYKIIPKSCQKFPQNYYYYSTDRFERLELVPTEFLTKGAIKLHNKILHKFKNTNNTYSIDLNINIEELKDDTLEPYKRLDLTAIDKFTEFEFYNKPKATLVVTPSVNNKLIENSQYKELIFFPKFREIRVEENCLINPNDLSFEMRIGIIIEGKISPPMDNVHLTAYNKETREIISSTYSDKDGLYKIGPLYKEFNYIILATKEGYKIVEDTKSKYSFNAEKLSFLRVKVVDTNNKPLSSVFLSLSSADRGFKINNNTNAEGAYDFLELYSGEYYIKPLLKEYKFEPSQKKLKILGGKHYEEVITAHRVAYSILGKSN